MGSFTPEYLDIFLIVMKKMKFYLEFFEECMGNNTAVTIEIPAKY